jgi:hypothetical protein
MTLHPPLGTPLWALYTHIAAGNLAFLFGAIAVIVRKGERAHRAAGIGFILAFATMLSMAVYMGLVIPQPSNVTAGLFNLYLIATAWVTVRRREGTIGAFEVIAPLVPAGVVLADLYFAWVAGQNPTGKFDRYQPIFYWITAGLFSIPLFLDLNMIRQRGLVGRPRIARHLWRMCLALFGASATFFLGQQQVMPVWMRGSPVLIGLALSPLALMVFWLGRVAWSSRFRSEAAVV